MKRLLLTVLLFLAAAPFCSAQAVMGIRNRKVFTPSGGGGSSPAYVSSGGDFSGGGSVTTTSLTAGNHLVVWTYANDITAGHTCTASGNTFVIDKAGIIDGSAMIGNVMHIKTIASTGTLTITCTGSTPGVTWLQYSGGTGDLDTTTSGTNPSSIAAAGTIVPAAFTPSTAATILVDGFSDLTGGTITLTQNDPLFTTGSQSLDGSSAFVGAIGYRVVSASASYSGGFVTAAAGINIAFTAAYK